MQGARFSSFLLFALAWCLLGLGSLGEVFTGRVVGVADGDSVTVLVGKTQHKVRLVGIDAPERGQPFGEVSKRGLSALVFNRTVRVVVSGEDRYRRTLGVLWLDRVNVNLAMVRQGWAWHYTQYSEDAGLAAAEIEARNARRGLWKDRTPVPPWDWRKARR